MKASCLLYILNILRITLSRTKQPLYWPKLTAIAMRSFLRWPIKKWWRSKWGPHPSLGTGNRSLIDVGSSLDRNRITHVNPLWYNVSGLSTLRVTEKVTSLKADKVDQNVRTFRN